MTTIPTNYAELSSYLDGHVRNEQGALDAYQRLVGDRPDDAISYLIRTILNDEARHHQLFAEILNSLESIIQWDDISPRIPSVRVHLEDNDRLLETTDRLLDLEKRDLKELKRLRKAWRKAGGEFGLWGLLVETAEFDTKKHIRILQYLRRLISDADDLLTST